ncbi:MAG TPA: hypothetical protein VFY45_07315 [Baekduia sp.]|jgi:hypothetical protein|nr:hypothetical protein [Baekduia sp.]
MEAGQQAELSEAQIAVHWRETTLANAEIVEDIRHHVQSLKAARGEVPRELIEQEIAAFGQDEEPGRCADHEGEGEDGFL